MTITLSDFFIVNIGLAFRLINGPGKPDAIFTLVGERIGVIRFYLCLLLFGLVYLPKLALALLVWLLWLPWIILRLPIPSDTIKKAEIAGIWSRVLMIEAAEYWLNHPGRMVVYGA